MELKQIRNTIDRLDRELLRVLHQRMEFALRAGKQKDTILDASRENEVLRNAAAGSTDLVRETFIRDIFGRVLDESKKLQSEKRALVGFQGEAGAWGDIAVRALSDEYVSIAHLEFADVFAAVRSGEVDFGIVPVENSLEGAVTEVNDLLIQEELKIVDEVEIPIHQNLLTVPGRDHREIKTVYSHPQALAQCRGFLSRNTLEPRPFYDTAGAARWLARERPDGAAVIASSLAAQLYGLEILKENIEDHSTNRTRFVLLSQTERNDSGGKCSIAFSTHHRVGALYGILRIFADQQINLTRIESRPSRSSSGSFVFLLDFLGRREDQAVRRALKLVEGETTFLKILGFYPEGRS